MSTIGFTTTDKIEARISKALGGNVALSAADKVIASDCLTKSYKRIVAILLGRGVTKALIDTWDEGAEYQLDIALYFYFTDAAASRRSEEGDAWLRAWDRRAELLDTKLLDADGEEIATTSGDSDGVATAWNLEDD